MNDCFWCFICGCCDGDACGKCNKYLSVNSETGATMLKNYSSEVDECMKSLAEKYNKKWQEYNK